MWHLALGLLQQLTVAPAIVVERNTFAYYKVPLRMLDTGTRHTNSSAAGLYYVLQCPPQLDQSIPKPRDMQTCTVIDQYRDLWQSGKKAKRLRPTRTMMSPLPPPTVKRLRWGWHQRRTKRHNQPAEATPLQHLGQPHPTQKLIKLAADHRLFKRGSSTKGYQHMYHRDESYNDHIFYDELQLDGKFHNRGQAKAGK